MLEPARTTPVEDDLMYSQPPPPHNLRWFALRSLDTLGRVLVGAFLCLLALAIILLFAPIPGTRLGWLFELIRILR